MTLTRSKSSGRKERVSEALANPSRLKRSTWLPVTTLVILAPWMAEMSWGGIPFTQMPLVLLFLGPVYGAAAILIREFARTTGRGWPSMLLWAAAFGVFQAGVIDQSLFNTNYGGENFTLPLHVPGIGVSLVYLLAFVSGHVVVSIGVPIALIENCSSRPTEQRWLSGRSLGVVAVIYVLGSLVNHFGVKNEEGNGFQAQPEQTLVAAAVALACVMTGIMLRPGQRRHGWAPPWWALLVLAFVSYIFYLPAFTLSGFIVGVIVTASMTILISRWSQSTAWSRGHAFALAIGVALTGAVVPFTVEPYKEMSAGAEFRADVVAAVVCLCVVAVFAWAYSKSRPGGVKRREVHPTLSGRQR